MYHNYIVGGGLSFVVFLSTIKGSPQFIEIEFTAPVTVTEVAIQFQGGFTSKDCTLVANGDTQLMKFYPDDSSSLQVTINKNAWLISY